MNVALILLEANMQKWLRRKDRSTTLMNVPSSTGSSMNGDTIFTENWLAHRCYFYMGYLLPTILCSQRYVISTEPLRAQTDDRSYYMMINFDLTQTVTTVFPLNDALISLSPKYQRSHVTDLRRLRLKASRWTRLLLFASLASSETFTLVV